MGSDLVYRHDDLVSTFEYYIAEAENGLCRVPRRVADDALLRIRRDAARITELEAALAASNARAEAAEAEAARLREENAALKKPDHYWEWDDPESGYDSFEDAVELADGMSKVVRLLTAKSLPDVWATRRVLTVDEHGDWDETEIVCFDNREEAERCWPESLAAARAALGAGWTPGDDSGYSKATCEALETCRALETLEAQLAGHALTAKEATANLLRADASEAAREAAEAKAARLEEALVAQRAFILHWTDDVNGGLKPTLGSLRSALDAVSAALEA